MAEQSIEVVLDVALNVGLGFQLKRGTCTVVDVKPGSVIDDWNVSHLDQCVTSGDEIVAVDGFGGDAADIRHALATRSRVVHLVIRKSPNIERLTTNTPDFADLHKPLGRKNSKRPPSESFASSDIVKLAGGLPAHLQITVLSLTGDELVKVSMEPTELVRSLQKNVAKAVSLSEKDFRLMHDTLDLTCRGYGNRTICEVGIQDATQLTLVKSKRISSMITLTSNGSAHNWNMENGEQILSLAACGSDRVVCLSSDGCFALADSASEDDGRFARILNSETGECVQILRFQADTFSFFALATKRVKIASFSVDSSSALIVDGRSAGIWNTSNGECKRIIQEGKTILSAGFSPDCAWVLTASVDRTAKIWSIETGKCRQTFTGHDALVKKAMFSQDGVLVLTTSADHTAKVWSVKTGRCSQTFAGFVTFRVMSADFSPDATLVLTACSDGQARIWSTKTGECKHALKCLTSINPSREYLTCAIFSASGALALIGVRDLENSANDPTQLGKCRIYSVETGRFVWLLRGHVDEVSSARFSADESFVVTASNDGTAKMWSMADGHCMQAFPPHDGAVVSLSICE